MGIIYKYTYNPTGEMYIGQTTNLEKRKKEHLNDYRSNQKFHNLLRKHLKDFTIEIIEDNVQDSLLDDREKYWIKYYNTFLGPGFNLTEGGDGSFSYCQNYWKNHPEKMKEHITKIQHLAAEAAKEWRKQNPEKEKERLNNLHQKSAEWRANNPEQFKENLKNAQKKAKEWREENSEQFEENRKKATLATSKKVLLVNTGETFISASEAGRIYNIPASNISGCCRGVRKSAGKDSKGKKLIWKYI